MTALATQSPFPQYFDTDGSPLDAGLLYFGLTGQNPETAPTTVYWDAAGTQPAAQPIITLNGYTARAGTPAAVYATGDYSLTVKSSRGRLIYTAPSSMAFNIAQQAANATAALAADLANNTNAAKGAALVGYYGPGSSSGTVAERLGFDIYVTDKQFSGGAIGNGVTDSTAALVAAVTYANSLCDISSDSLAIARFPRLIFPVSLGFVTTATLNIRAGVEVIMHSPLFVNAVTGSPIIGIDMIDEKGVDYQSPRYTSSIYDVRRNTQSNWSSENDIGVRIVGLYAGTPYFKRISGFCVGADVCLGYSNTKLGEIRGSKIGIKITSRTTPTQFTNQSRFEGGAFAVEGGVNSTVSRYGIKIVAVVPLGANTLLFDGQSFELNNVSAAPGDSIPYLIDGTLAGISSIRCVNQRTETNGGTFARLIGKVRGTEFGILDGELEYTYPTSLMLDDQSTSGGGNFVYRHVGGNSLVWKEFFNTGRLPERAVGLTGTVMSIMNMEACTNAGAAPTPPVFSAIGGLAAFDVAGYMTCAGPLYGVRVRLNGSQQIAISGHKKIGAQTNLTLVCFDSSGIQITSVGAVRYEQSFISPNTGVYGGLYQAGLAPANNAPCFDQVISFSLAVATVFLCINSDCDSWVLKRSDSRPEWFSSSSHMPYCFVGASTPAALTNVTYKQGMRVAQVNSTVGQPKGWQCTVPGVPTFVSEGNL